jgi:hypothetical protein
MVDNQAMIVFYRKHKDSLDLEWHFQTQCLRWPETNFVQVSGLDANEQKRLCKECVKLESAMFPRKE